MIWMHAWSCLSATSRRAPSAWCWAPEPSIQFAMTSSQLWPCAAVQRANLSARCTLRVGGHAEWLLEPADPEQLLEAWCAAVEYGGPRRLLGGGANLIVGDGLLPGLTISTERLRRVWRFVPPELRAAGVENETDDPFVEVAPRMAFPEVEEAPKLIAWAGTSMPGLVARAKDLGWSGPVSYTHLTLPTKA